MPAIVVDHICPDAGRDLLALSVNICGLGLPNIFQVENLELSISQEINKDLTENVIIQNKDFQNNNEDVNKTKKKLKAAKILSYKTKLDSLRISMDVNNKRCNEIPNEIGSSNLLSVIIPMKKYNYTLNKQQFWDNIKWRYGWPVPSLPAECTCGESFNKQQVMSSKKGCL